MSRAPGAPSAPINAGKNNRCEIVIRSELSEYKDFMPTLTIIFKLAFDVSGFK